MAVRAPDESAEPVSRRLGPWHGLEPVAVAGLTRWVLAVEVALAAVAVLVPLPVRTVLVVVMALLGGAAFLAGLRAHQPSPPWGWWLLAAGVTSSLAGVVALSIAAGLPQTSDAVRATPAPLDARSASLFVISYLLTIAGLAFLGRPAGSRTGWSDLIDAGIVAAAVFPVIWAYLDTMAGLAVYAGLATVLIPLTLVLIVVLLGKVVFAVGPTWATGWLVAAVAAQLAISLGVVLPALQEKLFIPLPVVPFVWVLYPVALGLAGLHPSMLTTTTPPARPERQLSVVRLALLAGLALLVPIGFLASGVLTARATGGGFDEVALVAPVAVVAMLVVVRVAIVARVAQRRAEELARQTRELDIAMREQEALRQQLTFRALHDPLTGLANRVVLAERLEWSLTRRDRRHHALLLLDLDNFKDVNDTLGHQAGDELLVAVAHRVLAMAPEGGMLARLGGDEFAALLEDIDPAAAAAWAERVLRAVRRPFQIAGRSHYQTTSIGLAVLAAGDRRITPSSALRDADLALYEAKNGGKDRVRRFEPAMVETRLAHSRLSTGLRRALANAEFTVLYQPVVDLTTGQVRAVEALLRWRPAGGEDIPPEAFIPVAEETGTIVEIGAWVLREACGRARTWHRERGVAVAVNVSGRQLVNPEFTATVLEALASSGLPGAGLILEVTETSMIATATADRAVRQLEHLRRYGVRVAIDDFGTGYSSLSYLARLPVDILKIDSSFTREGEQMRFGPEEWPLARAIMELGQGLRLTTVAEGIETPDQADAMRQLKCELAQGYLYSRPVPGEEIDALLAMPTPVALGLPPRRF